MACYVPFNSRNLDISFFMFRPTVVYVDDLIEALKQFSCYTESLGCVHSSIFTSIHGNMVAIYAFLLRLIEFWSIAFLCVHQRCLVFGRWLVNFCVQIVWYGAWMKRNDENKQLLVSALVSILCYLCLVSYFRSNFLIIKKIERKKTLLPSKWANWLSFLWK